MAPIEATVTTEIPARSFLVPEFESIGLGGICPAPLVQDMGSCHDTYAWWVVLLSEVTGRLGNQPADLIDACAKATPLGIEGGGSRRVASGGAGKKTWSANLYTTATSDGVEWLLRASGTEHELVDFVWLTGSSNADFSEGTWVVHSPEPEEEGTPNLLECTWSRSSESSFSTELRTYHDSDPSHFFLFGLSEEGNAVTATLSFPDSEPFVIGWDKVTGEGGSGDCCWGPAPGYSEIECP